MTKGNIEVLARDESTVGLTKSPPMGEVKCDQIVATAMDAIVVVDRKQQITLFNAAAEKMFRCVAADVVGKPISILIPSRFHEAHSTHVNNFGTTGSTYRAMGNLKPLAAVRADGEEFLIEASISRSISSGEVMFTVMLRDVTERVAAEETGRRLASELEAANQTLREQIQQRHEAEAALLVAHAELRLRAAEMERNSSAKKMLTEMSEFLQTCVNSAEASQVAARSLQKLFPDATGVVYLNREFGDLLEAFAAWNSAGSIPKETFEPQECWGLRRGRPHFAAHADATTKCAHLADAGECSSICVPMLAQGQSLGLLHMLWLGTGARGAPSPESTELLALSAAESLALALANVKLREKLREQTIRDPLTLLYNRRYLEDAMVREISRARRAGSPIGIIMIDVDNFKHFNDSFGHPAGDELLRTLGNFLKAHVRPEDIPARYGGEEFALILPGASAEIVRARAEKLRAGFREIRVSLGGSEALKHGTSLSCGVAVFPEHGASLPDVLLAADQALYEAKRTGRDRVIVSSSKVRCNSDPEHQAV